MYLQICALILVNIGSVIDLDSDDWFRDFDAQTTIHVIDSTRPQSLANLFDEAAEAQRIVVWDDGTANFLEKQKDFYLRSVALRVRALSCLLFHSQNNLMDE